MFFGDSGQGDALFAEQVTRARDLHMSEYRIAQMLAWHDTVSRVADAAASCAPERGLLPRREAQPLVFIHDVVGRGQAPTTGAAARAQSAATGIRIFDSFISPAVECWRSGLLDDAALSRVVAAARGDVGRVAYSSIAQRRARHAELEAACADVGLPGVRVASVAPAAGAVSTAPGHSGDGRGVHEILRTRPWV